MYAKIYRTTFRGKEGYQCDLRGRDEDPLVMSWFYPIIDGRVSTKMISEIEMLIELGYEISITEK